MKDNTNLWPGRTVTYKLHNGETQRGIVKSVPENDPESVFVVFNCNQDWFNYRDYTAQRTPVSKLTAGWDSDGTVTILS